LTTACLLMILQKKAWQVMREDVRIVMCKQGSTQWLRERIGYATASQFGNIVDSTGAPLKTAARDTYRFELAGEIIVDRVKENYVSKAMQRGTDLEGVARVWYELKTNNPVEQVGFIKHKHMRFGGSPDGLVGNDGAIEIKCLSLVNMLKAIQSDSIDDNYYLQMQGILWLTGRAWCDYVLYTDEEPLSGYIMRVKRDSVLMDALDYEVPRFCDEVKALVDSIKSKCSIV